MELINNDYTIMNHNIIRVIATKDLSGKELNIYGNQAEPLFKPQELANILGIKNYKQMKRTIDQDERIYKYLSTGGGVQQVEMLTEAGLYEVLMRSVSPLAQAFKKQVKKILKEIRTEGGYIHITEQDTEEDILTRALLIANKRIKEREKQLFELQQEKIQLEIKTLYLDRILNNSSLMKITAIAQDYGMSAIKFNKLLHKLKIQYKQGEQWFLYSEYKGLGLVNSKTFLVEHSNGLETLKTSTLWTQKGREFLYYKLKELGIYPLIEQ